jgi:hypothetical protein
MAFKNHSHETIFNGIYIILLKKCYVIYNYIVFHEALNN